MVYDLRPTVRTLGSDTKIKSQAQEALVSDVASSESEVSGAETAI
jgi:hypothetical protein